MEERKPQKLDTLAKQGKYWRITEIEGDTITARRISGADYKPRQGKAIVDTWENLVKKGYRLCDIAPVTVIKEGAKTAQETAGIEEKVQQVTKEIIEAEEAEQLACDGRRLTETREACEKSTAYRIKLISGREFTRTLPDAIGPEAAMRILMFDTFVESDQGAWFRTDQIESIRLIRE